ncbi:hypothetical protein RN001_005220 [Aquatica leii]|uniref:Aldehyde dehydrogenase domain-containing protein n=1 Tax=Aquatica leii TaxID=1421715 RepID=A0AAN7PJI6_9COLE|nr:hypothetical protein RN001_005220 [Aquatica leii]
MDKEKLKGGAEKLREKRKKAMEAEAHKSKNIKFMFEKLAPSSIISQLQPYQELSEKIVSFPEYVSSQVETRIQNEGENQASTSITLTTPCNFQSIAKTNEAKSSFQSAITITDSHYDSYFKKPNFCGCYCSKTTMTDKKLPTIKYTKLFINNEFVDAISKKTLPVLNPSTGKKIVDVAEGDEVDINKAVDAAKAAFELDSPWRKLTASERGILINKLADLIAREQKYLATLETVDNGKTYANALFDVQYTVDVFRYYAGYADKIHGNTIPLGNEFVSLTVKEPVGIVGQIIPWNYPLMMISWKWAPALAAGCTIVLKPAEQTPLSALAMAALTKEAGFPDGVINVVPGYGHTAGSALVKHPEVKKVAFTGSTEVGNKIMEVVGQNSLKRVSLELGGKSPLVVFDDFDVDQAVNIAYNACFANHGQNCCAGSRTYVQAGIYDKFVKKAVEKAKTTTVGDPFHEDTDQGPQVSQEMLEKVLGLIECGKKDGAKLETGGCQKGKEGYFIEPTVFSNVTDNMTIAREEIFGPVQSIFKFNTLEEVIKRANDTTYGLAAGVLTKDISTALSYAKSVHAGSVWVNCYDAITPQTPFGGYKYSGIGRELGEDGLKEYLEVKTITIKI